MGDPQRCLVADLDAEKQRPLTAEDLIRALLQQQQQQQRRQQRQQQQFEDDALKVGSVRFGGIGRK